MLTIQEVRELTGAGLQEIRAGMQMAETDDPLFGECYYYAHGCAVVVKGDRHKWNLSWARERYDALLKRKEGEDDARTDDS